MVLLVIFLGLFLLSIIYPRSKHITIAIVLFMLFVYAFTWHEGDLEVYEWVYRDLFTGRFYTAYEPGFVALMWLCKKVGLSFTGFRFVLGSFITIIIYHIVRRQTDYSAFAMVLYCLFPFFVFSSVLRSGISCVFVLLALEQLIIDKGNKKKYVIYILIGTLFHYSTVLFLPFLLFTGKIKKTRLIGAFVGMCVLSFLINYTNVMYSIVSTFTQRQKIVGWLMKNDATANINGIIAIGVLLIAVYLLNRNNVKKLPEKIGGGIPLVA
ncbi:MAG: EpsG family protein [Oribacterium sp.]|nr:EpsG family protein [Lachnospiraceae bacterium]MBP3805447.1 EpsG family protein [Oribacterium sp.]